MKNILTFTFLVLLLASCGKKENKTLSAYMSSFVQQNEAIAVFGKVELKTILSKAAYADVPMFGALAKSEIEGLQNELNIDAPIYFALEGPFAEDGTPTSTYLFAEVKNADSLAANLTKRGFDLEDAKDIKIGSSGDVAFGFQNNLFILVTKKGKFDEKELLASAFEKVYEDEAGERVNKILAGKGDVVYGLSIENLMNTSNTELKELPKEQQKAMAALVENSFMEGSIKLENGAATFQTNNLFSPELEKAMFMKTDNNAQIRSLLGTGQPRLGLSLNMDMKKFQSFMDDYAPDAMRQFAEEMGGPIQMAMLTAGDEGLSALFNGQLGFVMLGEPGSDGTFTPNFNVHVGLAEKGQTLAQSFQGLLKGGMAQVDLSPVGLSAYSNANYLPKEGMRIEVPAGCESFGKKGLTLFANLDGLNLENFELDGAQKLLNIVKYVTVDVDNKGVKIFIKAKDDNTNIAKQVVMYLLKELEGEISKLAI